MIKAECLQSSHTIPKVKLCPLELLKEEIICLWLTDLLPNFSIFTCNGNYKIKQLADHKNMIFFTLTLRQKAVFVRVTHTKKIQTAQIDTAVHQKEIIRIGIHRKDLKAYTNVLEEILSRVSYQLAYEICDNL